MHDREFRRFWKLFETFKSQKSNWIFLNRLNLFYQLNLFESISFSIWINWIILKWLNLFETIFKLVHYKVTTRTRTTIFKLLGPCESLSRSKISHKKIFFPKPRSILEKSSNIQTSPGSFEIEVNIKKEWCSIQSRRLRFQIGTFVFL